MDIPTFYRYLTRTRRDLRACLEALPDEALSRDAIPGDRFRSIKDLVFHVAEVEDGWTHGDIRREPLLLECRPEWADLLAAGGGPHYARFPVGTLFDYWAQVEASTLRYLERLTPAEAARPVDVDDVGDGLRATVGDLLWHVMQHEVRHGAQIALLVRQHGVRPPSLDLLFYLPVD